MRGVIHWKKGDNEKAVDRYLESIEKAGEVRFVRYLVLPKLKIGDIYKKQNACEKARICYQEALKAASMYEYESGIDEASKKLDGLMN